MCTSDHMSSHCCRLFTNGSEVFLHYLYARTIEKAGHMQTAVLINYIVATSAQPPLLNYYVTHQY